MSVYLCLFTNKSNVIRIIRLIRESIKSNRIMGNELVLHATLNISAKYLTKM